MAENRIRQTLDQKRAAFAWEKARNCPEEYRNLAKAAPALIMANGLMPSLAFWQSAGSENSKRGKAGKTFCNDLLEWVKNRFATHEVFSPMPRDFKSAMDALHAKADSAFYMQATDEALEFLKWLRQFADTTKE